MRSDPFEEIFRTELPVPNAAIDTFVVICTLIIIGLGLLTVHRLILPAGMSIELPNSKEVQYLQTAHTITIKSENLLIVDDEISSLKTLKRDMGAKITQGEKFNLKTPILLRMDAAIPLQTAVNICEILKNLGFSNVHIALNKSF